MSHTNPRADRRPKDVLFNFHSVAKYENSGRPGARLGVWGLFQTSFFCFVSAQEEKERKAKTCARRELNLT